MIKVPLNHNELLEKAVNFVNKSQEIEAYWKVINVNAIDRLGMSDHGVVHYQIVSNIALRLLRILLKNKITMSVTQNYNLDHKYAELVVFLTSLFHDLGMSINREGHEEFSLFLTHDLLKNLLSFLPTEERIIVQSETLHAIISHRAGGRPITVEGGVVRVADALDMTKGRTRIPFEAGKIDIYSLSAYAVDNIEIKEGKEKPVQIDIYLNNSSGIFQIDELLKSKMLNSGISQYINVRAYIKEEKKLLEEFNIKI